MQNTGRILTQSAVNLADKIGTPLVKSLGVDLNESADQTMNKLMVPLESGLAQLKRPRVKKSYSRRVFGISRRCKTRI